MATTAQKDALVALYAGYFDRAPDPAGLQFWIDQIDNGRDFNTIAADFAKSEEATKLYPFLTAPDVASSSTFITSVYQNLFNRAPDAEGLAFWKGVLDAKTVEVGDMIDRIINGARDAKDATPPTFDKATLDNKVAAGLDFAVDAGNTSGFKFDAAAKVAASAAISGVTNDPKTVDAAKAATDAFLTGTSGNAGQTSTLTTAVGETLVGSSSSDTFNGTVDVNGLGATPAATLNATDSIDGGNGLDTVNISATSAGATIPAGAVKNVEIVNLISDTPGDGFAAGTANVANFAGVQQLWQIGGTASSAVTGVTNDVTVGFKNTAVNDVQMKTAATTANVQLDNVTAGGTSNIGETTAGTLATVNVNGSVAGAGGLTVDLDTASASGGVAASAEKTVNLNLSSNGTIGVNSATATTVDASASKGNLTINVGASATKVETLKGGSGNDVLTGATASSKLIEAGAGMDTINAGGKAGEVLNGGANGTGTGNVFDTVNLGAGGVAQTVLTEKGHSGLTAKTIDQITGFVSAEDKLDFNLAAGSATNFQDGGASSGVTDALTNANTAFDGTVQYFSTIVGADTFVFVDSDLNGTADMAVQLQGTAAVVSGDFIA